MNDKPVVKNAVKLDELKVGDRVWDNYFKAWREITEVGLFIDGLPSIRCGGTDTYDEPFMKQHFFWGKPIITITITGPDRPKRKVKKKVCCIKRLPDNGTRWLIVEQDDMPVLNWFEKIEHVFTIEVEE